MKVKRQKTDEEYSPDEININNVIYRKMSTIPIQPEYLSDEIVNYERATPA